MNDREKLVKTYYERPDRLSHGEKIVALTEIHRRDVEHWDDLYEHGCSDPYWTDGANLNLVRGQVMASIAELKELGADVSGMYVPPEVNENLMVAGGPNFEKRCKRLSVERPLTVVKPGDEVPLF